MISRWQFETALWTLTRLDMQGLVDAGATEDRDYVTWDAFKADPVKWFMMHPSKADAVWRAIGGHKPSSQMDEPPQVQDNVVTFPPKRQGH